jgi:hypothetical protein
LHAERHFVLADARLDLGVAILLLVLGVEFAYRVEHASSVWGECLWAFSR